MDKILELLNKVNNIKQKVKDLVAENKIEEAKAEKENLIAAQAELNEEIKNANKNALIGDLEDGISDIEGLINQGKLKIVNKGKGYKVLNAFVNAVKAGLLKKAVAQEDMEILNSMTESSAKDGGLTVPEDLQTKIKELRRSEDSLEVLVNIEPVKTISGMRVIEKKADQTPFDNVEEEAEFEEESTPEFENIEYKVKKKGGILKVSRELLEDSSENILAYLKKWIAKKSKATRNFLIVKMINEVTTGKEKEITGLDDLKKIFNVDLDPAIALTSKVVTNQDGYNWLDTLKDSDGRYILQLDPSKQTQMLLFGKYPITKVSNKTLKTVENKVPIVCGDLKEAITIFDRELMTVEMSTEAGDLWVKDQNGIKVRERLDIQPVDVEAIIKAVVEISI